MSGLMPKTDLNPDGVSHAGARAVPLIGLHAERKPSEQAAAGGATTTGSFGFEVDRTRRPGQAPWTGLACPDPDCGGTKTKVRTSGRDEDDRPLRERVCADCGQAFVTVETYVVPIGGPNIPVRFAEVDVEHKRRARESKRRRFGWQPQPQARRAKVRRIRGTMTIDGRRR